MSGFTAKTRELIVTRDDARCKRCGRGVYPGSYSIHHRRARGMGGSSDPATNSAANGVVLCGSGTTGCHGWVEAHRDTSRQLGFLVYQGHDPATVPVCDYLSRWLLLDNDGDQTEVPAPKEWSAA